MLERFTQILYFQLHHQSFNRQFSAFKGKTLLTIPLELQFIRKHEIPLIIAIIYSKFHSMLDWKCQPVPICPWRRQSLNCGGFSTCHFRNYDRNDVKCVVFFHSRKLKQKSIAPICVLTLLRINIDVLPLTTKKCMIQSEISTYTRQSVPHLWMGECFLVIHSLFVDGFGHGFPDARFWIVFPACKWTVHVCINHTVKFELDLSLTMEKKL